MFPGNVCGVALGFPGASTHVRIASISRATTSVFQSHKDVCGQLPVTCASIHIGG